MSLVRSAAYPGFCRSSIGLTCPSLCSPIEVRRPRRRRPPAAKRAGPGQRAKDGLLFFCFVLLIFSSSVFPSPFACGQMVRYPRQICGSNADSYGC